MSTADWAPVTSVGTATDSGSAPAVGDVLVDWYATAARDLPWRRPDVDAWAVLVSEVMLQQTPVTRVEPVWREWMGRWPAPAGRAAPGRAGRRDAGRGDPGVGQARLPPAGAPAARSGGGDRRAARRGGA